MKTKKPNNTNYLVSGKTPEALWCIPMLNKQSSFAASLPVLQSNCARNSSLPFSHSASLERSNLCRGSKHCFIQSSSVVLVWILNKKRLILDSPLLNKPSRVNSLLPQQLWPHLGHNWKGRWKELCWIEGGRNWALHLSRLVTRLQAGSGKHKFLQSGLTWGNLKKLPVSLACKNVLWITALALWKMIRKIKNLCQFSKITNYVLSLRARA